MTEGEKNLRNEFKPLIHCQNVLLTNDVMDKKSTLDLFRNLHPSDREKYVKRTQKVLDVKIENY